MPYYDETLAKKIMETRRPEEVFGSLDGGERAELVGNIIPTRLANLTIQMESICRTLWHPTPEISSKLLTLFRYAVVKIRSNCYATGGRPPDFEIAMAGIAEDERSKPSDEEVRERMSRCDDDWVMGDCKRCTTKNVPVDKVSGYCLDCERDVKRW